MELNDNSADEEFQIRMPSNITDPGVNSIPTVAELMGINIQKLENWKVVSPNIRTTEAAGNTLSSI